MPARPLALLTLILLTSIGTAAAQSDDPVTDVTVDLVIDNDYNDSEESLANVRQLLKLAIYERVSATDGASLDQQLFDRYDFGPSQLPRTWKLVRDEINRVNDGRKPHEPWRIPAIPRRRLTQPNPNNPYYELPRVARYDVVDRSSVGLDVTQVGTTESDKRKASRITLLQLTMPRSTYDAVEPLFKNSPFLHGVSRQFAPVSPPTIRTSEPPKQLPAAPPPFEVANPIDAKISGNAAVTRHLAQFDAKPTAAFISPTPPAPVNPAESSPLLTQAAAARLSAALKPANAKRNIVLLILDYGWPDATEMTRSVAFLESAINRRRAKLKLPTVALPLPALGNVSFANHSADVKLSLEEIVATIPNPAIEIVYVPIILNTATAPIFRELFELDFYVRYMPQSPTAVVPDLTPFTKSAKLSATLELTAWAEANKLANDDQQLHAGVLNAVYRLLESRANADKSAFVVNQSWTIRGHILDLASSSRAITVSATGNDGFDVLTSNLDFAQRSARDDGFLAVVNADTAGRLTCGSGSITDTLIDNVNVVAFDGSLPNGHCGTSFATPRVAWFIAAKSAVATAIDDTWNKNVQHTLRAIRPGGNVWLNVYFDAVKFIEH